jgi:hypothetical protein
MSRSHAIRMRTSIHEYVGRLPAWSAPDHSFPELRQLANVRRENGRVVQARKVAAEVVLCPASKRK